MQWMGRIVLYYNPTHGDLGSQITQPMAGAAQNLWIV